MCVVCVCVCVFSSLGVLAMWVCHFKNYFDCVWTYYHCNYYSYYYYC